MSTIALQVCGTLTPVQTHPSTCLATLRTVHWSALYPCQATQPFHLLYLADLHAGHGVGRDGIDRGAVGDERFPERNPRAHVGRVTASGGGRGWRTTEWPASWGGDA